MTDLASRYLGLDLKHPIVASASPLTATFDGMRRLEDAQAAAVVMASLNEEQIQAKDTAYAIFTEGTAGCHQEAANYFPKLTNYRHGVSGHLETLSRAAKSLHIPVIASLNGATNEGWLDYAVELQQAGAAALELNLSGFSADPNLTGAEVEQLYLDIVRRVKNNVSIPLAVKLLPFFSATVNFVGQLQSVGIDGVVLFNQYIRPDFDLDSLSVKIGAVLSTPADIPLPLAWTALLSPRVGLSVAAGTGVDSYVEIVKFLLAGADVVNTASSLLRHGPEHMATLVEGLRDWLSDNGFASVTEVRGRLNATHFDSADMFLRSEYLHTLYYLPQHSAAVVR